MKDHHYDDIKCTPDTNVMLKNCSNEQKRWFMSLFKDNVMWCNICFPNYHDMSGIWFYYLESL